MTINIRDWFEEHKAIIEKRFENIIIYHPTKSMKRNKKASHF